MSGAISRCTDAFAWRPVIHASFVLSRAQLYAALKHMTDNPCRRPLRSFPKMHFFVHAVTHYACLAGARQVRRPHRNTSSGWSLFPHCSDVSQTPVPTAQLLIETRARPVLDMLSRRVRLHTTICLPRVLGTAPQHSAQEPALVTPSCASAVASPGVLHESQNSYSPITFLRLYSSSKRTVMAST